MSTPKRSYGAQTSDDGGTDPRPWMPVTDGNRDGLSDVADAEPDADVIVRSDRTVFVSINTRHTRAYHLFPDCHFRGMDPEHTPAGSVDPDVKLCAHCERREGVRAAVSNDPIPPNPTIRERCADPRDQMPDGVGPSDAGDWLGADDRTTRQKMRRGEHGGER